MTKLCKWIFVAKKTTMIEQSFIRWLESQGYRNITEVPGRGICALYGFVFTTGLCINISAVGYGGRYCYTTFQHAAEGLKAWNGEGDPPGKWIKFKGTTEEYCNKACI